MIGYIIKLTFKALVTLLSPHHNPVRSFTAFGAKVQVGKQWVQGDQLQTQIQVA